MRSIKCRTLRQRSMLCFLTSRLARFFSPTSELVALVVMEINFLKFLCDWVRVSDGNLIRPWRSLENEVWLPVRGGEGSGVQIESNPQTWAAVQLDSCLFIIHHSTAVGWRLFYMCNKARRDVSERHWQNHADQPLCCWMSQVRDALVTSRETDGDDSCKSHRVSSYSHPSATVKRRAADWASASLIWTVKSLIRQHPSITHRGTSFPPVGAFKLFLTRKESNCYTKPRRREKGIIGSTFSEQA